MRRCRRCRRTLSESWQPVALSRARPEAAHQLGREDCGIPRSRHQLKRRLHLASPAVQRVPAPREPADAHTLASSTCALRTLLTLLYSTHTTYTNDSVLTKRTIRTSEPADAYKLASHSLPYPPYLPHRLHLRASLPTRINSRLTPYHTHHTYHTDYTYERACRRV